MRPIPTLLLAEALEGMVVRQDQVGTVGENEVVPDLHAE